VSTAGADASLAGVPAVVTGASRGIGAAVARALAAAGADVALVARSREPLEALAAEAGALGRTAFAVPCDLRDAPAVNNAVDAINTRFARPPRILVSAAGTFHLGAVHEALVEEFEATIGINLVAGFRFIRAFLPAMRAGKAGHVVTIGSVADHSAWPGNAGYAASKYGMRAVHEVLRAETRGSGVRATLVSPGATDTALWDALDPDSRSDLPSRAEMLRPEDIAAAVIFAVTRPQTVNVDEIRMSRA
jgi:NADP-dependent 3-hydroxy acid dehydrogenase YdfG